MGHVVSSTTTGTLVKILTYVIVRSLLEATIRRARGRWLVLFHTSSSLKIFYQSRLTFHYGRLYIAYPFESTVPRGREVETESIFARLGLHLQIKLVHFRHESTTLRLQPIPPRLNPVAPT